MLESAEKNIAPYQSDKGQRNKKSANLGKEGAQGTGPEVADLRELAPKVVPPPAELFGRGVGGHGMASPPV